MSMSEIILICQNCGSTTIADESIESDSNFICFDCRKLQYDLGRMR